MRFTTLRVTPAGIVLRELHRRRLDAAAGPRRAAFQRFAAAAEPGVYALWLAGDGAARWTRRERSLLADGMAVRYRVSPVAGERGRLPKPPSPGPYDAVRAAGFATLLTDPAGSEVYEGDTAAVLGWDGARWLHPPDDRPRVWSTAEVAVREHLPARAAPLPVAGDGPLVLVNAVKGPCTLDLPHRPPVPPDALAQIERLFAELTA